LSDKIMVYGLVSRGYKAGGVNSVPELSPEDREFSTELMWNIETGIKGSWLDSTLDAQISAFYQQRKDIQIKQSLTQKREDSNAPDFVDFLGNSAQGSNYGLEVEFNWMASENLTFFGSLGLLQADYDIPLFGILNNREQAQAPDYQYSLGGTFRLRENIVLKVDLEGKDEFYLSSGHNEKSDAYQLLNANMSYFTGNWQFSMWGRNLTDQEVIVRGFNFAGFSGEPFFGNDPRKFYETEAYYQYGEPRMFGLSGKYSF